MPDDYLTIDEVAAQLAVPLEMIQRRIESGDIPVHWVEINGKLEMRVSAAEIGVGQTAAAPTPFPTPEGFSSDQPQPEGGEVAAQSWNVRESTYPQGVWTPAEGAAEPAAAPPASPWEVESEADLAAADVGEPGVPVWRPDPGTWEDEPLQPDPTAGTTEVVGSYTPAGTDSYFPLADEPGPDEYSVPPPPAGQDQFRATADQPGPAEYGEPPPPAASDQFPAPVDEPEPAEYAVPLPTAASDQFPAPVDEPEPAEYAVPLPPATADQFAALADGDEDEEQASPFGSDEDQDLLEVEEFVSLEAPLPSELLGVPEALDVPRPSALAKAQGPDSALAINSIDARELVAGLFERWERALEQRIQAEQRLRFEAELERRLRQVRDLRQELENTRKSTAAQLAEREQEVLTLRNQIREQGAASKGRGLFRR